MGPLRRKAEGLKGCFQSGVLYLIREEKVEIGGFIAGSAEGFPHELGPPGGVVILGNPMAVFMESQKMLLFLDYVQSWWTSRAQIDAIGVPVLSLRQDLAFEETWLFGRAEDHGTRAVAKKHGQNLGGRFRIDAPIQPFRHSVGTDNKDVAGFLKDDGVGGEGKSNGFVGAGGVEVKGSRVFRAQFVLDQRRSGGTHEIRGVRGEDDEVDVCRLEAALAEGFFSCGNCEVGVAS